MDDVTGESRKRRLFRFFVVGYSVCCGSFCEFLDVVGGSDGGINRTTRLADSVQAAYA